MGGWGKTNNLDVFTLTILKSPTSSNARFFAELIVENDLNLKKNVNPEAVIIPLRCWANKPVNVVSSPSSFINLI